MHIWHAEQCPCSGPPGGTGCFSFKLEGLLALLQITLTLTSPPLEYKLVSVPVNVMGFVMSYRFYYES